MPTETLFDEQFLNVLHAIEEITDTSSLRDAVINLPKDIYEIVKQYEKIPVVPVETTDNLIYNIAQTYYYTVIESLCKIMKTVQQGQRTSLVSLAKVIVNQKETIQKYQTLSNLHTQMQEIQSKLEEQINQVKQQTSNHLDRIDRQAITTYTTISEIKSQIHKIESSLERYNPFTEQPERQGICEVLITSLVTWTLCCFVLVVAFHCSCCDLVALGNAV